ncbi:MAG TPA: transcriptional repressor LexA, partial [Candidatus Methylomirabilis sp.]|nr:transcriptional repressor LexA [Candidatus Methylomirabilis sp.]
MRLVLTARQREVLDFIRSFIKDAGYPPTVREIGAHFGFVPRSVFDHLKALERKGYLRRAASKSRSLQILDPSGLDRPSPPGRTSGQFRELPILGRVAAGSPLLADENVEGTLTVARDWVNGDEAFFLKVEGESMINAHILPGDYALVRHQATAESGEIVVALVNGEATIKRVVFKKDVVILQPEHPSMPPIHVRRG